MTFIIAIDGPAGAGKSTVARQIANRLSYTYLDTGAMYRAVAWKVLEVGADPKEESGLVQIVRCLDIEFGLLAPNGTQSITIDGVDATNAIRSPEVSSLTSSISTNSKVRKLIVEQQRAIVGRAVTGVVLEGRDIGTVVFPHAQLKVFLTASPEERAARRTSELSERGAPAPFALVLQEQVDRDMRDSSRAVSPLVPALDAVHVNTDGQSVEDVVQRILQLHAERLLPINPTLAKMLPERMKPGNGAKKVPTGDD